MTQDKIPTQTDTYENDASGVKQWLLSTAGSLLSVFLPQGLLDFKDLTSGPASPPSSRMRLSFVNGSLSKTSDSVSAARSAVRPTPLSAVPVYGSTAALAFESAWLSWGPLGRPYFYGSLPALPSTAASYVQTAGDGQYIAVSIPANTYGTPVWEWWATMPADATAFGSSGIRLRTRLRTISGGPITLTFSVSKQDGTAIDSTARASSTDETLGTWSAVTSLSALSGGDVFKMKLAGQWYVWRFHIGPGAD